jgi:hypothetical protein
LLRIRVFWISFCCEFHRSIEKIRTNRKDLRLIIMWRL